MCLLFNMTQNHLFSTTDFKVGSNTDTTTSTVDNDNYTINVIAMLYIHTLKFLSQKCIWLILFGLKL